MSPYSGLFLRTDDRGGGGLSAEMAPSAPDPLIRRAVRFFFSLY